jgi:environmental stress-induced protein Ves
MTLANNKRQVTLIMADLQMFAFSGKTLANLIQID